MEVVHPNQKQLAARWSISEATLERGRSEGLGPKFLKLCGRVLYRQVTPNLLGEMLPQAIKLDPTLDEAKITVAMTRLDAIWDQLFPAEQTRIVKLLVEKVIVSPNDLEVRLRANGIERLVLELRPEPVEQREEALA